MRCNGNDKTVQDEYTNAGKGVAVEKGSVAIVLSAVMTVTGDSLLTRCSQCLAIGDATPILTKAIDKKARLIESCGPAGSSHAKIDNKTIQKKGMKCGVRLDGDEANSLKEFVALKF